MFGGKIPHYFLIESLMRQKLLSGRLQPGERLPSEVELASQFGVNRITVRKALANLSAEKMLIRRRGKGTFVTKNIPQKTQVLVMGDVQRFVQDNKQYKIRLLGIEEKRVHETRIAREVAAFLGLKRDDPVGVMRRLRLLEETPVMLIENFLLPSITKHLDPRDLEEMPFQEVLKSRMKITSGRVESTLECVPADPDVAEDLRYHVFAPLFLLQSYVWLPTEEPLELVTTFMMPDYFKFALPTDRDGVTTR